MAFKVETRVEVDTPFPAFGEHRFKNPKTGIVEDRDAHMPKPKRHSDGNISLTPSNQYNNILVYRIFNTLIRQATAAFFDNPALALNDFDSGYVEVSIIVAQSGAYHNYPGLFIGEIQDGNDEDIKEVDKYPINSGVIDAEDFSKKKLSDVRQVKDKTYSVNVNIGDYIYISCRNKARVGMCGQLTLLYRVENFGLAYKSIVIRGEDKETTIEYPIANCKLAYVIASDVKGGESRVGDRELISEENIAKFRGPIMGWINERFDALAKWSDTDLNYREIGRNMFVNPWTVRSVPDDWTTDAIGAINILKLEGGDGGQCFDEDYNFNVDDEEYEREVPRVDVQIADSSQEDFYRQPITCFVKDYICKEVDTLRALVEEDDYRPDKARLVKRNFVYNHKVTIRVDSRWIEDDQIEVTFSFPSVASLEIGAYTFIFKPEVHMLDQLSHAFFKDICMKVRQPDGSLKYDVVLDRAMSGKLEQTKYVTTLTEHYNPKLYKKNYGLRILPTSDDVKDDVKNDDKATEKKSTVKKGAAAKKTATAK